ncbi:hypothetical protein M8J75_001094 [Diaphorina citri]|nr:hypothetical protein M8J75_001094 [Diaphorina citri]
MNQCNKCVEDLPVDGDFVTCGKCKGNYHYKCNSLGKSSWMSMSTSKKKAWKCTECRSNKGSNVTDGSDSEYFSESDKNKPQGSQSRKQGKKQDQGKSNNMDDRQNGLTIGNMEELFDKKFKELSVKLNKDIESTINSKLQDFIQSLEFIGGNVDELTNAMKNIQQSVIIMDNNQKKLEAQNIELKTKVDILETKLHEMNQDMNMNKIEITGIPPNVDANAYTEKVFEKIKVNDIVKKGDYVVEKIIKQGNKDQPKQLVVQFESKYKKEKIMQKVKEEKPALKSGDITNIGPSVPIYINEYLTPYNKRLFFEAKKMKNDKNYAYLWIKNGQILLKKTNASKVMRLSTMNDLTKL